MYDSEKGDRPTGRIALREAAGRCASRPFAEDLEEPCGHCDRCGQGSALERDEEEPFAVSSRVFRKGWGDGVVVGYEDGKIVVVFERVGRKTLDVGVVVKRNLLKVHDEHER